MVKKSERFCPDTNHNVLPNKRCSVCGCKLSTPCDRCETSDTCGASEKEKCKELHATKTVNKG